MSERALTPTSYLVLGLVRSLQPCTSYEMKQLVGISIGHFWSFPHSQLYAEPARLVEDGLLTEDQEQTGRKRRLYRLTTTGEEALDDWLGEPVDDSGELRDLGLLKLFFAHGASPAGIAAMAASKHDAHLRAHDELAALRETVHEVADRAQMATLELGMRWHSTFAGFWDEIANDPPC